VAPFFLKRSADILGVPAAAPFDLTLAVISIVVVTFIVGVFTLVPAWRAGRIGAIDALNSGNDSRGAGVSRLGQLAAALRLPRVAVVGVKDLSRRPFRTAMTVAAVAIAVITATFSLGIESTFDKTMKDPTVIGGPPFEVAADRDTLPEAEARAILDANTDVEAYLAAVHGDARIGSPATGFRGFEIWAFEGDLNNPRWAMREGRMPVAKGEAAVSTELTRTFGIDVGDTITVFYGGSPLSEGTEVTVTIVGRFVSTEGENMHVTRDTLPGDEPPTDFFIVLREGADARTVADSLISASRGNLDPEVLAETIDDIRHEWRPVIAGLNAVLFSIAGINLLSSQLLSIRERRRDFAVLKAIGFTPAQIVASVFSGSAVLALIGVAVGIPLGLLASRVMFDILSSAAGIGTGVGALPGLLWLAPLVPLALIVAAIASAIPARIAANLQVAEALRYE
jgi:putative ABC transport system permease protein